VPMDRKVIRRLALVPTPVEKKKLEDETARLEAIANASSDKYLDEQINHPEPEKKMSPIPKNVATVLGVISVAALAVAQFVPAPFGTLVSIIAFVLGTLSGLTTKAPAFLEGRPVLQGSSVGVLAAGIPLAASAAASTTGWVQFAASTVALLLAWLTGKAAPQLGAKAETPPAP